MPEILSTASEIKVEMIEPTVIKMYSTDNLRSAIFDVECMSVYLFKGNSRIIATSEMKNSPVAAHNICKRWVKEGSYYESDFAK